ncbi:DNA repair protein RadC (plasmid) [Alkalihalophilus sp. As8PL]|uniref:DNA repair protein RadC n=1 Tax=Alkalihalophilus sp. As8PL TaxID=3237103 RepID=A0AB39BNR0_9BACI
MKKSMNEVKETMVKYGADSLSFHDLLLLLIGKENQEAVNVLATYQVKALMNFSVNQFQEVPGVGKAIAERLYTVMQLTSKAMVEHSKNVQVIRTPEDSYHLFKYLTYKQQETFCVAYLDTKNKVIAKREMTKGTLNSSYVHPREVFKVGVELSAASVVVCHNHPSGDVTISDQDRDMTKRLFQAGKIIGIEVLDHIIVGDKVFVSLKEQGVI